MKKKIFEKICSNKKEDILKVCLNKKKRYFESMYYV